jgi:hypothetical protein
MIFSIRAARTIPSLVSIHWLTSHGGAVSRFTGDAQIGNFVMAITSVSEPGRETHGHAATLEEAKAKLRDSKRAR